MSNDDMKSQTSPAPPEDAETSTDLWLSKSIHDLPQVEVPSNFLPNVMFKVYEKHARNLISLPKFYALSILLLLLCIGFFVWDVHDHMITSGETTFRNAFAQKMELALSGSQQIMGDLGGLFTAAWQIAVSAMGAFFTQASPLLQLTVFLTLIGAGFLFKKGWSSLA